MPLRLPHPVPAVAAGLASLDLGSGLVFVADPGVGDGWDDIATELTEAFELSRDAAQAENPTVYIVGVADLLGQRGPGPAMVATGLLSAARTAAVEGARRGVTANVLAVAEESDADVVARWVERLLTSNGVTGELVRLGSSHLGKALP